MSSAIYLPPLVEVKRAAAGLAQRRLEAPIRWKRAFGLAPGPFPYGLRGRGSLASLAIFNNGHYGRPHSYFIAAERTWA